MIFLATAVCFLFTFANVSCQGRTVASFTGIQLAFGTTVRNADMWGNPQAHKMSAEPLATLAFIVAVAGIAPGFLRAMRFTSALGVIGAFLLFLLKSQLDRDAATQSQGLFEITPGFGWAVAILLFLIAAVASGVIHFHEKQRREVDARRRIPDKIPDMT